MIAMQKHINIPVCEDPQIIINPRALYLIQHQYAEVHFYNVNGVFPASRIKDFPRSLILRKAYELTQDHLYKNLEPFTVSAGSQTEFLFMLVPCNKCDLCGYRKQIDKVMRAALDESVFSCPPLWFTLTYKPSCLPEHGELRYKDVQDFFKRLRRRLDRMNLPTDFRYIVSGEYGKKGRPHYHVIMYNNPYRCDETQASKFNALGMLIFDTWGKAEPQAFFDGYGQCYGACSAYVTKYLTKSFRDTTHVHKPFVHCSIKNGGLGRQLLNTKVDFYRQYPTQPKFVYKERNGLVKELNFSSYLDRFFFPSACQSVPIQQRLLYREYIYTLQQAVKVGLMTNERAYAAAEDFRPYKNALRNTYEYVHGCHEEDDDFFQIEPDALGRSYLSSICPKYVGNIVTCLDQIERELDSDVLVDDFVIKNYEKFHDSHLFDEQDFVQKVDKAHKAKKQKAVAQFNEKL